MYAKPMTDCTHKLTDSKSSHIRNCSTLFNWILNKAFVVSLVTFLHMLNAKGASIVSLAALEPRFILVNIFAIFLPQEL